MATEKNLYGRIAQKIDTAANWEKAINFIPKKGEIIVYAKDENCSHDRIKIGDGTAIVKELPFIDESKASKEYVDQKVLNKISIPTKASVGQTIVVKTVDTNGVPTSWEAVDLWVMTAPNGTRFKLTIDNEGVMTATEIV